MTTKVSPKVVIREAKPSECGEVALLLKTAGLPIHDIDTCLKGFLVAYHGDTLAGTVGIETHGQIGLLRSLAVAEQYRNEGVGHQLYERALAYAASQGIVQLYLLTTTAEFYFEKRGFQRVERESVPRPIQQTEQFSSICPESAAVMELSLGGNAINCKAFSYQLSALSSVLSYQLSVVSSKPYALCRKPLSLRRLF